MTFVYILLAIAVMAILFILGIILLIRGFLKRYLAEYAGKNTPKVLMTTGIVFISLPVIAFVVIALWSITSSVSTIYNRAHYQCIPDVWRKETVSQSRAEEEIIKALLVYADKGDKEAFEKNFTPELQKRKDFDKTVSQFLSLYPVGLSRCRINDKLRLEPVNKVSEDGVKSESLSFSCVLDGTWYFMYLNYCYRNPDEPDKVGVTNFMVMNLEAAAAYRSGASPGADPQKHVYLLCDFKSSREVDARLIGGRPYLWFPTDTPTVTADELRGLVKNGGRLDDPALKSRLGEPNVGIKQNDSAEYGYIYEIASENGEPRYVYFQTDAEFGRILCSYLCTPYEVDYDKPLFEDKAYR